LSAFGSLLRPGKHRSNASMEHMELADLGFG
jgi:hypothetical protein